MEIAQKYIKRSSIWQRLANPVALIVREQVVTNQIRLDQNRIEKFFEVNR